MKYVVIQDLVWRRPVATFYKIGDAKKFVKINFPEGDIDIDVYSGYVDRIYLYKRRNGVWQHRIKFDVMDDRILPEEYLTYYE